MLVHYPCFAVGALLLTAPLLGHAQTTPETAPLPRFYVGLAAFHSNFQNLGSWQSGDTGFRVPVQLTAGYQLRPRLALELGAAYRGRTSTYADEGYYASGTGAAPTYYQYRSSSTHRTANVSALARFALRRPSARLQVEALGGLALVHNSFYLRGSRGDDFSGSFQSTPFATRGSANEVLLTAGVGVRYRFTPRLALNFDFATNRNLNHPQVYNGYTGSAALGLRYGLGLR